MKATVIEVEAANRTHPNQLHRKERDHSLTPVGSPTRREKIYVYIKNEDLSNSKTRIPCETEKRFIETNYTQQNNTEENRQITRHQLNSEIYSKNGVEMRDKKDDNDSAIIDCPFSEFGCEDRGNTMNIRKHIRDAKSLHLLQICDAVTNLYATSKGFIAQSTENVRKANDVVHWARVCDTLFSSQYIWHIFGYSKAYMNARVGKPAIIYSPTFFSHRHGYKMALVFAPYGDGDAIGEANSVFVTIVRGEYDGVLPWPFSCPITFTMVNQAKGADVSLTITPRITENNLLFLDRPKADRNPAFGLKSFVDLRFMKSKDEFVRDDCCFIRVDVDLSPIYDYI